MTDLSQALQLEWHDHLHWSPAMDEADPGRVELVLNFAGYELVCTAGLEALRQAYLDALAAEPSKPSGSIPGLSLTSPPKIQSMDLPDDPPLGFVRYWHGAEEKQSFLVEIRPDWTVFAGHFPNRPILPGILQLHWASLFAHTFLGKAQQPTEVRQLKFRNVFIPPGCINLELTELTPDRLAFCLSSAAGVHAQGQLIYAG